MLFPSAVEGNWRNKKIKGKKPMAFTTGTGRVPTHPVWNLQTGKYIPFKRLFKGCLKAFKGF